LFEALLAQQGVPSKQQLTTFTSATAAASTLQVVKGGKIMGFRCVAVVGDGKGRVGVGCQAGREVSTAVKRALVDAKKVRLLLLLLPLF
jgi:ribosomal protein S5